MQHINNHEHKWGTRARVNGKFYTKKPIFGNFHPTSHSQVRDVWKNLVFFQFRFYQLLFYGTFITCCRTVATYATSCNSEIRSFDTQAALDVNTTRKTNAFIIKRAPKIRTNDDISRCEQKKNTRARLQPARVTCGTAPALRRRGGQRLKIVAS